MTSDELRKLADSTQHRRALLDVADEIDRLKEELRLALAPAVAEVCLKPSRAELKREIDRLTAELAEAMEHISTLVGMADPYGVCTTEKHPVQRAREFLKRMEGQ